MPEARQSCSVVVAEIVNGLAAAQRKTAFVRVDDSS